MAILTEASWKVIQFARFRQELNGVDKKTAAILIIVGLYCWCKMICIPLRLLHDVDAQLPAWQAHVANNSVATCQRCIDLAFRGFVPQRVNVELTHCFEHYGDKVNISKPEEATKGNAIESWKKSWAEFGDDWWTREPLRHSPIHFDSRWLFPNFSHQQILRVGRWWPDQLVGIMLAIMGLLVFLLVLTGLKTRDKPNNASLSSARNGVILSSFVLAAFTPFFVYRLAQSYTWEIVGDWHAVEGCAHVYFGMKQFTTLEFYMLACWYGSMILFVLPCLSKVYKDTDSEGNAAIILEGIVAGLAWVLGLIFEAKVRADGPSTSHGVLQSWLFVLIFCVVDCIVLAGLLWILYKGLGIEEANEDKVMPF